MPDALAPYAATEEQSRGRLFPETSPPYRCGFEQDRDRIVHSSAFRRLEGKTQVFMPGINENYRTRLTHSLEVSLIGRTIAGELGLNANLTEAVCLGHDLGHSPFGHGGERVLDELMREYGGFEHNRQALRIVEFLEHPYADFAGLNLTHETRLAFARHHGPQTDRAQRDAFEEVHCTLEGQIADLSDRIAYNCHDLEDGLRSRLIHEPELMEVEIFREARERFQAERIGDPVVRRARSARTISDLLVSDAIETSRRTIEEAGVRSMAEVCRHPRTLVRLSREAHDKLVQLELFLLSRMYEHESLREVAGKVEEWLGEAFELFRREPGRMPRYFQAMIETEGLERVVCDYIAGMTDRYCLSVLGRD